MNHLLPSIDRTLPPLGWHAVVRIANAVRGSGAFTRSTRPFAGGVMRQKTNGRGPGGRST